MKKITLIICILFANLSQSQCNDYSQLLTAGLNKTVFFDVNYGFVFGQGTLIHTTDGGASWNFIEVPFSRFDTETMKYCDKLDDDSAIIVGADGTMLKTIDKGQTWTTLSLMIDGRENINCVDFVDNNIGYAEAYTFTPQQSFLMKTTDAGLTWNRVLTNFHQSLGSSVNFYDNITIRFLDEMTGFAWSRYYLFKTMDGGLNWTPMQNPDAANPKLISMLKVAENNQIVVSLQDGINYLYVSSDSGNSWSLISGLSPSNNIYVSSYAFEIKNNKVFAVGQVGFTTTDSFLSYDLTTAATAVNTIDLQLGKQSDLFFTDADTGFIIDRGQAFWSDAPGRKILKTTNGGLNWSELDSFSFTDFGSFNNIKVLPNSSDTLTLTKQDDYGGWIYDFFLYTSTNNGATWQEKVRIPTMIAVLLKASSNYISYLCYKNIYNGAEGYSIYESNDLGNTWEHSDFIGPDNIVMNSFEQLGPNTLKCGLNTDINLSFDRGQTWTNVPMPSVAHVDFFYAKIKSVNEIYAWGSYDGWPANYDYYLYKTTNLGQTWQLVTTIPDNNGADLGARAISTFFGSDFAIVSTGGNTYFRINLTDNTYTSIPFVNPISGAVYLDENSLKILNDTTWLINTQQGYKTSTDQGQTWVSKKCLICSDKIIYNDTTGDFISYDNDHGVERIKGHELTDPTIYGESTVEINGIGNYFVPYNPLATTQWELVSGGTLTVVNANYVRVNWTQAGEHIIRVKYINSCGETDFYEFTVMVSGPLSTIENGLENNITSYPNPFKDTITIKGKFEAIQSLIDIYNVNGQLVYSTKSNQNEEITLLGLSFLKKGTYFLVLRNDGKNYVAKIVKE